MKCLILTSGKASRCVPLSKIEEIVIDYSGEINGREQWTVCVRHTRSSGWFEYYNDYAAAMARFNELVTIMEENDKCPDIRPSVFGYCDACADCRNKKQTLRYCWDKPLDVGATGKAVE